MKKILFILTLGSLVFLAKKFTTIPQSNTEIDSQQSTRDISADDAQPMRALRTYDYIGEEIKQNIHWRDFKNYDLPTIDLVAPHDQSKDIAGYATAVAKEVSACLNKDLCGIKPDPKSPYFDSEHTEAHDLLERSLSILVTLKEAGSDDFQSIGKKELLDALQIRNETIQGLALELLLAKGISDDEFIKVLGMLDHFHSDVVGAAFGMLNQRSLESNQLRDLYLEKLTQSFLSDDGLRVVNLAKSLQYIDLERSDLENIAKAGCSQKDSIQNIQILKHEIKNKSKFVAVEC